IEIKRFFIEWLLIRSGRKPVICLTIRAARQTLSDLAFSKILAFYAVLSVSSIECYCFYR
ncbi:hypothetical protein, partial [Salmonella enterica]|uniref:hypothetical protein n=1 Tax=Salmonella enterica TaxID=28901 RepID=UPI001C378AE5